MFHIGKRENTIGQNNMKFTDDIACLSFFSSHSICSFSFFLLLLFKSGDRKKTNDFLERWTNKEMSQTSRVLLIDGYNIWQAIQWWKNTVKRRSLIGWNLCRCSNSRRWLARKVSYSVSRQEQSTKKRKQTEKERKTHSITQTRNIDEFFFG